jgi:hypothetical protein
MASLCAEVGGSLPSSSDRSVAPSGLVKEETVGAGPSAAGSRSMTPSVAAAAQALRAHSAQVCACDETPWDS